MSIGKQNKTLLAIVVIFLSVLAYVLFREGQFSEKKLNVVTPSAAPSAGQPGQSAASTKTVGQVEISTTTLPADEQLEKQKVFAQVMTDLTDCLSIKSGKSLDSAPVSTDTVLLQLQSELGPASSQGDRWMNWHLRTSEGTEKHLRIEITESDDGKVSRELHYFTVNKDGDPIPVDLGADRTVNPKDDFINHLLKEGEVIYKERAGSILFTGGERFDYVEKNGVLSEIEFTKGEQFFKCQNLNARENCQCVH